MTLSEMLSSTVLMINTTLTIVGKPDWLPGKCEKSYAGIPLTFTVTAKWQDLCHAYDL